jgi:hypothetical protein
LPPASRRYLIDERGETGCPLCMRRARGSPAGVGPPRSSHRFLSATWVVLTVGEPMSPA